MDLNGLVSNYTVKQFKVHKSTCNEDKIENKLNREFDREKKLDVVVSDLTYVNVKGKWNYICLIIDLLETELFDYVNWYNNFRIHSSLDYLTPVEYKKVSL